MRAGAALSCPSATAQHEVPVDRALELIAERREILLDPGGLGQSLQHDQGSAALDRAQRTSKCLLLVTLDVKLHDSHPPITSHRLIDSRQLHLLVGPPARSCGIGDEATGAAKRQTLAIAGRQTCLTSLRVKARVGERHVLEIVERRRDLRAAVVLISRLEGPHDRAVGARARECWDEVAEE